jgi:membrane fusion protein
MGVRNHCETGEATFGSFRLKQGWHSTWAGEKSKGIVGRQGPSPEDNLHVACLWSRLQSHRIVDALGVQMSLFRREAIEHQQRRLFGETTIHLPVSLVTASLLGVALCVGFLVLLSLTPFPRKEVVSGRLEPAAGLAEVTQPVGTTVVSVEVAMGDLVEKGTLLARLEEDLSNEEGRTAGLEAANLQSRRLEARRQFESTLASYRLQERGYLDRAEAADAEVANLQDQIVLRSKQVVLAREQLARIQGLLEQGYVSRIEADRRADSVLQGEAALLDLRRLAASRASAAMALRNEARVASADADQQAALQKEKISELDQADVAISQRTNGALLAPVRGRIAAINILPGRPKGPGPAVVIEGEGKEMYAVLSLPSKARGFVEKGQEVRIMVDAFPFQRFGLVDGRVDSVAQSPAPLDITVPKSADGREDAYLVRVALKSNSVTAYGRSHDLRPGMKVRAHIILERRSLITWLLDPLAAARAEAAL